MQFMDDSLTAAKINKNLIAEPNIRSLNIDVDVYNRYVFLNGSVRDRKQKKRVVDIAQKTEGVVKVVDNLIVQSLEDYFF